MEVASPSQGIRTALLPGFGPDVDRRLLVFADSHVEDHRLAAHLAVLHILLTANRPVHCHFKLFTTVGTLDDLTIHGAGHVSPPHRSVMDLAIARRSDRRPAI